MAVKKRWYLDASPELGKGFRDFSRTISEESSLDEKTVELIKVAVSSVVRCRHCTEDHIVKALKAGATKHEITDALFVSSLQCAGTQLYWAEDIFQKHLGE